MTAEDLSERIGHEQAHNLSPLAAGADLLANDFGAGTAPRYLSAKLSARGAWTVHLYAAYLNLRFREPVAVKSAAFDCGL